MMYCSVCGNATFSQIPPGDNRLRECCAHCGTVHYVNPRPVVGTIPVWGDQILLCKRAIEPRLGKWTLPAGFMETGESTGAGAVRETVEEAGARVILGPLFSMIDVPHVQQVHIFFRAELLDTEFSIGTESLDVRLFSERDVPWAEIAFRTVSTTLELFFADRARGEFGTYTRALEQAAAPVHLPRA
ncbi:MAG: NUDIX hydrolase [Burkholderiaceae bacterium]|nr:NUDIX hydrolase [Burkholderiaceae bacterium]